MNTQQLTSFDENGVINMLRWFAGLRLTLAILSGGLLLLGTAVNPLPNSDWVRWLTLLDALVLLGYLSWGWLRMRLGRIYLPLALAWAIVLPLIEEKVLLLRFLQFIPLRTNGGPLPVPDAWQSTAILLVPFLLLAWQYRFVKVFWAGVATFLFDSLLTWTLLTYALAMQQNWVLWSMGGSLPRILVFLMVGYILAQLVHFQREQQAALAQANAHLARYATTLEHLTISRERNRMARELHDTLAHTLSGIAVQLEAVQTLWNAQPQQAHDILTQAMHDTRAGLTETRRALQALRASPLEDVGLPLALKTLTEQAAARSGFRIEAQIHVSEVQLSPEAEQAIYRIAQEAIENAIRHAQASEIKLLFEQRDGKLRLQVQDDGRGFAPSLPEAGEHWGLRGLYERAQVLGGQLTIESGLGNGTRVTLWVAHPS